MPKNYAVWASSSSLLTVLTFVVLPILTRKYLTGSTPFENYFTFFNLLGMLFYGLQVAIIAEFVFRFRLKWSSIFLVGLIYGILEEGFAVQTMEHLQPPAFVGLIRFGGLNILWSVYIAIFHALIS